MLLAFAAIAAALLLRIFADAITRWTCVPEKLSLSFATLVIVIAVLASLWLFGRHMVGEPPPWGLARPLRAAEEFSDVLHRAAAAWNDIVSRLQNTPLSKLDHKMEQNSTPVIGASVRQAFSLLTEAVEASVVLLVSAIYLAAEPRLYRIGVIKLFRPAHQAWAGESIDILGFPIKSIAPNNT